jgi:hypothetical protein
MLDEEIMAMPMQYNTNVGGLDTGAAGWQNNACCSRGRYIGSLKSLSSMKRSTKSTWH